MLGRVGKLLRGARSIHGPQFGSIRLRAAVINGRACETSYRIEHSGSAGDVSQESPENPESRTNGKMDATDTTALKPKSIGLIIASTRQKRLGPSVAELVQSSILDALRSVPEHQRPRLQLIDLADHALPWFDEPEPPMSIKDPAKYSYEHTRSWSATIAAHDAFVFVTPQYNWSIPGVLKNALDFLYSEWNDKPALIVSYGARGGGKAQEALRAVLQGLRMRPLDEAVGLPLSELKGGAFAAIGAAALSNPKEAWKENLERLEILVQEQWL